MVPQAHFDWYRSIFINSVLIFWAFRLTLDPTKPLDDMGYMISVPQSPPCAIEFETRNSVIELRRMLELTIQRSRKKPKLDV